jgi:hypothetical protein
MKFQFNKYDFCIENCLCNKNSNRNKYKNKKYSKDIWQVIKTNSKKSDVTSNYNSFWWAKYYNLTKNITLAPFSSIQFIIILLIKKKRRKISAQKIIHK